MAMSKYKLTFPKTKISITQNTLTFYIGHIKSRLPSILYFKFYGYDLKNNLISEYTSDRWVITTEYTEQYETFTVPFTTDKNVEDLDTYQMEVYLIGVDSEKPLYMNKLQLNEGDKIEYHTPNEEQTDVQIGLRNTLFANIYNNNGNFLQIIRPNQESFTLKKLTPSKTTILAPHLDSEPDIDNATAIFYEYMYQKEQVIGVEK